MILVARNVRCGYSRGFLGEDAANDRGLSTTTFLAISVDTSSETFQRRLAFYAVCRQRSTRKPCCGRETAQCRCKIRYVSKSTAASRDSPCDSTAFLFFWCFCCTCNVMYSFLVLPLGEIKMYNIIV